MPFFVLFFTWYQVRIFANFENGFFFHAFLLAVVLEMKPLLKEKTKLSDFTPSINGRATK